MFLPPSRQYSVLPSFTQLFGHLLIAAGCLPAEPRWIRCFLDPLVNGSFLHPLSEPLAPSPVASLLKSPQQPVTKGKGQAGPVRNLQGPAPGCPLGTAVPVVGHEVLGEDTSKQTLRCRDRASPWWRPPSPDPGSPRVPLNVLGPAAIQALYAAACSQEEERAR